MITGLFIVGLGFSLQQTAANPLAIVMGDPKKGSQRLSLAGGINNIGTTIGPLLVVLQFSEVLMPQAHPLALKELKFLILFWELLFYWLRLFLNFLPFRIK